MNILDFNISFEFIGMCIVLGMFGQFVRCIVGIYKMYQSGKSIRDFKIMRLITSLAIGGCVGLLICLVFNSPLSKTDILCMVSSGYAGSDSIEGMILKR